MLSHSEWLGERPLRRWQLIEVGNESARLGVRGRTAWTKTMKQEHSGHRWWTERRPLWRQASQRGGVVPGGLETWGGAIPCSALYPKGESVETYNRGLWKILSVKIKWSDFPYKEITLAARWRTAFLKGAPKVVGGPLEALAEAMAEAAAHVREGSGLDQGWGHAERNTWKESASFRVDMSRSQWWTGCGDRWRNQDRLHVWAWAKDVLLTEMGWNEWEVNCWGVGMSRPRCLWQSGGHTV